MTKYIFLSLPAHGHVNPTLAVVRELVERGEEVICYLTEEFRSAIEATGASFRAYQSTVRKLETPTDTTQGVANKLPVWMMDESTFVMPQVMESIRAEQPDCILYDTLCLWGRLAAASLHVPSVLLRPSFAPGSSGSMAASGKSADGDPMNQMMVRMEKVFQQLNEPLADLCRAYSVKPFEARELFLKSEPFTLIFVPREFQPGGEKFDQRFVFVGPSIQPRQYTGDFPLEKLRDKTVLYISLGTVYNNHVEFYNQCFEAFGDTDWQVVLSTGKHINPDQLGAVPENFLVAPSVPQLDVLQHADVFITHCGMNSILESLYYGVPMVAVPQMPGQKQTAKRIQELGLGIELDKDNLSVETLRTAVERVMNDPDFQIRAEEMQQKVRETGGYKKAADAIQQYVSS